MRFLDHHTGTWAVQYDDQDNSEIGERQPACHAMAQGLPHKHQSLSHCIHLVNKTVRGGVRGGVSRE